MAHLPLVSPLDRALFLKAQPYLDRLSPNLLAALASYSEEQFYPAGTLVRAQNAPIDELLFLASGRIEITRPDMPNSRIVEIEAPGAVGLAHHFAHLDRSPAVHAAVDTLCLVVATIDLDQILEDHFALFLELARTSCEHAIANFRELASQRPPEEGFPVIHHHETPIQLDLVQRLAKAKSAPLLRGTNLTVLGELIRFASTETIAAGTKLWSAGDPIDRMVLVLDGSFHSDGEFGRCEAPSGATLGAWEILASGSRFEGWVAKEPSRIMSIRRDLFTDLLEDHFEFALDYLGKVSQKVVDGWDAIEVMFQSRAENSERSR